MGNAPALNSPVIITDTNDEAIFFCVTSAITLAKEYQVKTATRLRGMLLERGFEDALITKAFSFIGQSLHNRYSSLTELASTFER